MHALSQGTLLLSWEEFGELVPTHGAPDSSRKFTSVSSVNKTFLLLSFGLFGNQIVGINLQVAKIELEDNILVKSWFQHLQ
jgi:hypothetical protein